MRDPQILYGATYPCRAEPPRDGCVCVHACEEWCAVSDVVAIFGGTQKGRKGFRTTPCSPSPQLQDQEENGSSSGQRCASKVYDVALKTVVHVGPRLLRPLDLGKGLCLRVPCMSKALRAAPKDGETLNRIPCPPAGPPPPVPSPAGRQRVHTCVSG